MTAPSPLATRSRSSGTRPGMLRCAISMKLVIANDAVSATHHSRVPNSSSRNMPTGTNRAMLARNSNWLSSMAQQVAVPVQGVEDPVDDRDAPDSVHLGGQRQPGDEREVAPGQQAQHGMAMQHRSSLPTSGWSEPAHRL